MIEVKWADNIPSPNFFDPFQEESMELFVGGRFRFQTED